MHAAEEGGRIHVLCNITAPRLRFSCSVGGAAPAPAPRSSVPIYGEVYVRINSRDLLQESTHSGGGILMQQRTVRGAAAGGGSGLLDAGGGLRSPPDDGGDLERHLTLRAAEVQAARGRGGGAAAGGERVCEGEGKGERERGGGWGVSSRTSHSSSCSSTTTSSSSSSRALTRLFPARRHRPRRHQHAALRRRDRGPACSGLR